MPLGNNYIDSTLSNITAALSTAPHIRGLRLHQATLMNSSYPIVPITTLTGKVYTTILVIQNPYNFTNEVDTIELILHAACKFTNLYTDKITAYMQDGTIITTPAVENANLSFDPISGFDIEIAGATITPANEGE